MTIIADIRRNALRSLIPPPRIALSQWIEAIIKLLESTSALPGSVQLWPYQRDIADAMIRVMPVKPIGRMPYDCSDPQQNLPIAAPLDGRGHRTPQTMLLLDERDHYLREAARRFCVGMSDRAAAEMLHSKLGRYRQGA